MVRINKKNNLIFISLCFVLVLLSFVLFFSSVKKLCKKTMSYADLSHTTIIIDPGHGGEDGGASSEYSKFLEKDINLEISKDLSVLLECAGYKTIMTRTDDNDISDKEASTRKRKISDMHNRLKIAQKYDQSILISIHQNKFSDSKYHGTQVFFSQNNENSRSLAESIQVATKDILDRQNERNIKAAGKNIYLLHNCSCPAVLVECGFLSNPNEAENLNNPKYQKQVSFAIFAGVCKYFICLQNKNLDISTVANQ